MKCTKCGGELIKNNDDLFVCTSCGARFKPKAAATKTVAVKSAGANQSDKKQIYNPFISDLLSRLISLKAILTSVHNDKQKQRDLELGVQTSKQGQQNAINEIMRLERSIDEDCSLVSDNANLEYEEKKSHILFSEPEYEEILIPLAFFVAIAGAVTFMTLFFLNILHIPFKGEVLFFDKNVLILAPSGPTIKLVTIVIMFLTGAACGIAAGIGAGIVPYPLIKIPFLIYMAVKIRKLKVGKSTYKADCDKIKEEANKKIAEQEARYQKFFDKEEDYRTQMLHCKYPEVIKVKMNIANREFIDLINPSDYESVDYIIYLFVTFRADSIKDALLQLDAKKRNDELVGAIHDSSEYLAKNIAYTIKDLGNKLTNRLDTLDDSINKGVSKISDDLSENSSKICEELYWTRQSIPH